MVLPILGVDGSEKDTVPATSPVAGKAVAKSGTTGAGDLMNGRVVAMTRALTGYMTAQSGRELTFAIYVNDVPLVEFEQDLLAILREGVDAVVRAQGWLQLAVPPPAKPALGTSSRAIRA